MQMMGGGGLRHRLGRRSDRAKVVLERQRDLAAREVTKAHSRVSLLAAELQAAREREAQLKAQMAQPWHRKVVDKLKKVFGRHR